MGWWGGGRYWDVCVGLSPSSQTRSDSTKPPVTHLSCELSFFGVFRFPLLFCAFVPRLCASFVLLLLLSFCLQRFVPDAFDKPPVTISRDLSCELARNLGRRDGEPRIRHEVLAPMREQKLEARLWALLVRGRWANGAVQMGRMAQSERSFHRTNGAFVTNGRKRMGCHV